MRTRYRNILYSLILLAGPCHAAAPCAATLRELRALFADPAFPLAWRETGMDDGKPLLLSIGERDGALFVAFVKSGEGLWAEGATVVCRNGNDFDVQVGSRSSFTLTRVGTDQLLVATLLWTGKFSSSVPK